jgi:hypothetical protein
MFLLALYYRPECNDSECANELPYNKILTQQSLVQVHSQASKIEYIIATKCHYND